MTVEREREREREPGLAVLAILAQTHAPFSLAIPLPGDWKKSLKAGGHFA